MATETIPGDIFLSYSSSMRKEKGAFMEHSTLVMQVSGRFTLETAQQKISMGQGEMLLIHRNQLGQIIKMPPEGGNYQTIVIKLQEEMLRQIALEEHIETDKRYTGPANILIPETTSSVTFFSPWSRMCVTPKHR